MTVTCDTVRRAFGEFQCCPVTTFCHTPVGANTEPNMATLCCEAFKVLRKNGVVFDGPITHPALLRAIEEEKP